jgi:glycosyl transferase, family 25
MSCPVYLINLPRDRERGELMQQQIAALGLSTRRVDAVLGRDLSPAQREQLYSPTLNHARFHKPMSAGEIGCYASHLRVWQTMASDEASFALVLEDDVLLGRDLPDLLAAVAALPATWDMIKLIGRDRERVWRRWPLLAHSDLVRYRRAPSLTGAYLLSRAGARKLAGARQPFFRPVDVDLRFWWETDLRLYGLQPYPVSLGEASFTSSIGQREQVGGLAYRWRKFRSQVQYSLGSLTANWRSRHDSPLPPDTP